jgi:hypothetical protein
MNPDAPCEIGKLLSNAWILTVANWQPVAIAMLLLTAPAILIDLYSDEPMGMNGACSGC